MAWMSHPKLDGRLVEVPDSAVQEHRRAGWEPADPPPEPDPPQTEDDEALANAGASAIPESPQGRRTTRGDE